MAKDNKPTKSSWKTKLNLFIKGIAFSTLVVLAAYGLRHMFATMKDELGLALTFGIIFGLVYILFGDMLKD